MLPVGGRDRALSTFVPEKCDQPLLALLVGVAASQRLLGGALQRHLLLHNRLRAHDRPDWLTRVRLRAEQANQDLQSSSSPEE